LEGPPPDEEGPLLVVTADGKGVPMRRPPQDGPRPHHRRTKGVSVKSTEGRKRQGTTPGHNPNHKGRDCYQWAVAVASGLVVWQQLCRGCTSGLGLVKPALEALRQRMPNLAILRLDGGFLAAKVLTDLESEHVGFLTKAGCKLVSIRALVGRTRPEQWQSYDEDTRLCRWNRVQLLDGYRTAVTVVLVECRRRIKRMRKGRLSWKTRVFHYAIVTDQHRGIRRRSTRPTRLAGRWRTSSRSLTSRSTRGSCRRASSGATNSSWGCCVWSTT
jgi:hypothetical protein